MDHDTIAHWRSTSRAWRLLRADTAPLALSVMGQVFVVENVRTIAESDLLSRVDDLLHAANTGRGDPHDPNGDRLAYPRSARDYLDTWAAPEQGWLRKFYPDGADEPHYDATVDLEKAYAFVAGLPSRPFVGTGSRLHTIVELLRGLVAGADEDPEVRLAELRRRRDELDDDIARVAAGESAPLDPLEMLDRYQHLAGTARELLADFRAVEENLRGLDRSIRADMAAWDGSKGELLDRIVGERYAIADSDQGRSFQAFHDFLLSRTRREELTGLLERLVALDAIEVDPTLGRIHFDWLNAAERTQQTVRLLSEQLRRFLDDKVWVENRRVVELLRSIERSALAVRDVGVPDLEMELDATSPEVRLPFERPLYAPSTFTGVDSALPADAAEALDLGTLFEQVYVDTARLTETVRTVLRDQDQISLERLLAEHPPTQGIAELVAYLGLTEPDFEVVFDPEADPGVDRAGQINEHVTLHIEDAAGTPRSVRLPQVVIVRRDLVGAPRGPGRQGLPHEGDRPEGPGST